MSIIKQKMDFINSPTEDIFPWVTPESDLDRKDLAGKRKCGGDSGYMSRSVSPESCHSKTPLTSYMLMTPDISSSTRYCGDKDESFCTPAMKYKADCGKKRLLQSSHNGKSLLASPEVDSFSDLYDASLYNEPMDISLIRSTPRLKIIAEEGLDLCEISKKITVDLSVDSFRSEPITPMRSSTPCDRLFRTPASLKGKFSSTKKKKVFLKKKHPKPGSMIGCDHIDIFAHLGIRANFMLLACKIMDYLSGEDISNITMVSKTWKNVSLSFPKVREKWLNYISDKRTRKENIRHCVFECKKPEDAGFCLRKNQTTPFRIQQSLSPPVSPSKFRFHLFQKEAGRLKEDEKLTDCPRCSLPSTVSPRSRLGRCTRAGCGLEFCYSCRSPYHGTRPCTTSTPVSPQRPQPQRRVVGSKESKRFLRRL